MFASFDELWSTFVKVVGKKYFGLFLRHSVPVVNWIWASVWHLCSETRFETSCTIVIGNTAAWSREAHWWGIESQASVMYQYWPTASYMRYQSIAVICVLLDCRHPCTSIWQNCYSWSYPWLLTFTCTLFVTSELYLLKTWLLQWLYQFSGSLRIRLCKLLLTARQTSSVCSLQIILFPGSFWKTVQVVFSWSPA